ncbi:low molecular weight phosphatase family protein [Bifidobacterium amazonense]|uniref:Low molecular weight phosphatase family protein n=1 Tax=Bifidobacterium amazonense TaxID=2809027 RepID=A0ABS9VVN8_9BIFI|nr:low molecular weight phosphatase family protein [Bifidobacterium amazonense]MCH9276180.1 low molecular weight phosphatase family protein [Bifidobacterium amazonense]
MKVLFVCTGNICRSPMGELLLPRYFADPSITADSAGTRGLIDHEIDPSSAKLLAADGIDSSAFRSKRITPQLANDADLILCFEPHQRQDIATIAPRAGRRTFLLTDFANMCTYCAQQGYLEGSTQPERLESVIDNASMIRPMLPAPLTIEDPHRKEFPVFQKAHDQICQALTIIANTTK